MLIHINSILITRSSTLLLLCLLLPVQAQASLNVFACEPEWAALAHELGGNQLDIYSATTAMQDPHHIQARPSLIAKARRADLLFCTGAGLETGWLPLLVRKSGNANIQQGQPGYFMAADYVEMLDVPVQLDRSLGDIHAQGNPHIHTDPDNILRIAGVLQQRLLQLDAGNSEVYEQRYHRFAEHWAQKIIQWNKRAQPLRGKHIVMHHNYWTYMNHWLGLETIATLEPVPGISPSSTYLAKVRKQVSDTDVAMIISAAYVDSRPAQWLSSNTGIPVVSLPATVDYQQGQTLEQWFDGLITELLQAKP